MKRIFLIFLVLSATLQGSALMGSDLPAWDGGEDAKSYFLGGGLWPRALLPNSSVAPTEGASPTTAAPMASTEDDFVGPPSPEDLAVLAGVTTAENPAITAAEKKFYGPMDADGSVVVVDASLQRVRENPDGTFSVPEEVVDEQAYEPLPPLEGELADLYFAHPPVELLIDPQHLLTEQKSNDIMRFLEFHDEESKIRIYVMAIGENQKIPEGIDLHALHEKWFGDSPAVLMLYYREQPQKTELIFNESIQSSLPKTVFDRILENTLREGGVAQLAPDQVEKMTIELSIQLYWLSRLMEKEKDGDSGIASTTPIPEMMASHDAPELLREYAPSLFLDDSGKILSVILTVVFLLGGLAAAGCVAWIVLWWRKREALSGEPLLFPELQITRRLGGEFCGGNFVSMSFNLDESM